MIQNALEVFNEVLLEQQLVGPGQTLLVAVSGGQDSTCLLHLLDNLIPFWHWHLGIVHCDHQWHTQAQGHARQIYSLLWARGLRGYTVLPNNNQLSSETRARIWRSNNIRHVARSHDYDVVALGHTASDRVETVLAHGLRGSGLQGLQALPWKRILILNLPYTLPAAVHFKPSRYNHVRYHWAWGKDTAQASLQVPCSLIRPLLAWSRATMRDILTQHHLPVCVDASNYSLCWQRNRIRHQLLPYLRTYFNPQIDRNLLHSIELVRGEHHYMATITDSILTGSGMLNSEPPNLIISHWRSFPLAIQRRTLRQLCALEGYLSFQALEYLRWHLYQPQTTPFKQWRVSEHVSLVLHEGILTRCIQLDSKRESK